MAELQLYMHHTRQIEILSAHLKYIILIKKDGSVLSGDKVKEKLEEIVKNNTIKNLRGDVYSGFTDELNTISKEELRKAVKRAYDEIRYEAERTQNTSPIRRLRETEQSALSNWLSGNRRMREVQRNRNASNTRQRNFRAQSRRSTAASTIQRILGSRVRHVSRTASRPPLPAIRRRTTSRS